jgi:hypothetical protein
MLEQHDKDFFNTFKGQKGWNQIIKHVNGILFCFFHGYSQWVGCGVLVNFQEHKMFFYFIKGWKIARTD